MKIKNLFPLVFFLSINIYGQYFSVSGRIASESNKLELENANVVITNMPDGKHKGIITGKNGSFEINSLIPGKYVLSVSYVGYITYKKNFEIKNRSVDFGTIYLKTTEIKLGAVIVKGEPVPVNIKADTTEYNAGAFKTNKDADAEDLITKMPGITVQNGTVQAQGENVTKVLVDGREFFGSDPNTALKNLPAEIIEKIQVFDQESDQAQFTGFDDGNTSKTINIVTRLRDRQGPSVNLHRVTAITEGMPPGGILIFSTVNRESPCSHN